MATVDLIMPKLGESIIDATILNWLKKPGDFIKLDEPVLEIATDKVDSEVPSTAEGYLDEILYKTNDVAPVGAVIARIKTSNEEVSATPPPQSPPPVEAKPISANGAAHTDQKNTGTKPAEAFATNKFYSPLVLNIAANEGISLTELEQILGTGNEGRVTKKDILNYLENKPKTVVAAQSKVEVVGLTIEAAPAIALHEKSYGNVEIIEMSRMRKMIAEHMVRSVQTSPHVTSFSECDVTNMVQWRERNKKEFEKREGAKITFTPLIIEAIVRCIKRYPLINCSLEGDKIIIKKDINIGMATALPGGNLIVPVIRSADMLNLIGLTKTVNNLADAARNGRLKADDTAEGTFTFTNVGSFGSLMGTPIINQPQVAILAAGVIKKRPVVIETPHGDSIAIRHMLYLSLSYDHRIVDGSLGATFLTAVATELECFDANREW